MRRAAIAGTAAMVVGLGAVPAIAQGHSQPDPAPAVASSAQQKASGQSEVLRSIPWKKSGRGAVKKCARHGTKYEYKVRLHNKCRSSYTYHLKIAWGPDRCKTVPGHSKRTVKWRYPGRLEKVTNGHSGGRC
ncbi:hypothetical protein ABZ921_29605 [Streptomyces atriruber]|uniref:Uncharacterized protein n=1 Tax=Streptomyces atriruber TaxID=545121 RepID=A0ABV3BUU9_9ACTN